MVSKRCPGRRFAPGPICLAALLLSGCSTMAEALQEASGKIGDLFGEAPPAAENSNAAQAPEPAAAIHYRAGMETRKRGDNEQAFASFATAARLGHSAASYEVSRAYVEGRGVDRDLEAAAHWTNLAADRGDARAQFLIGAAYYGGIGVPQDYEAAAAYLSDAAAQGHAQAQYLLGEAYSNGRGVEGDAAWAARWYGKAARQGLGEAQYAAGVAHATGLGVPLNRVAGYGWLRRAAQGGHAEAEAARRALAARLGPDQLARAEAWAANFRPRPDTRFADEATVIYVQNALNGMGFDAGPVDGITGPLTRSAIEKFQAAAGLPSDGHISPALVTRLRAGLAARAPASKRDAGG